MLSSFLHGVDSCLSPSADNQLLLLAAHLRKHVQGEVLFDRASRGRYATDASIYQVEPVGVLVPATHEDVRIAVDVCRDLRVPMLPQGSELFLQQLIRTGAARRFRAAARLSLLPALAAVAFLNLRITGDDKGVW